MQRVTQFIFPLLLLLFTSNLNAIIYENAEDMTTTGWTPLTQSKKGSISNLYDNELKSNIIAFKGMGTQSAYILKLDSNAILPPIKILQWEMNFSEDFVIMVDVSTQKGKRLLIYTAGDLTGNLQYGLGEESLSGKWQSYSRNLEDDLKKYEENNTIISLNNFIVRGSGKIDNIKLLLNKTILAEKPMVDINQKGKKTTTYKETLLPTITLLGDNPLLLKNGERYKEPGATAKDLDGSTLPISISENIDIFKDGEYSVIYMVENSIGNTAVDRRIIRVGNVASEKNKIEISHIPSTNIETVPKENEEDQEKNETNETEEKPIAPVEPMGDKILTPEEFEDELAKKVLFEREMIQQYQPTPPQ